MKHLPRQHYSKIPRGTLVSGIASHYFRWVALFRFSGGIVREEQELGHNFRFIKSRVQTFVLMGEPFRDNNHFERIAWMVSFRSRILNYQFEILLEETFPA
jgi:hypothetical protein